MKVIIAGSRGITDYDCLMEAIQLCPFIDITEIVSGNAKGVDSLGEEWALNHARPCTKFPASWVELGKSAGFVRNVQMADYADALIAIWDGQSKGTFHMIGEMVRHNKPVFVYCP